MWRTTLVDPQPEGKHRFVLHQPLLLIFKSELNVNMRKKSENLWLSLENYLEQFQLFQAVQTTKFVPPEEVGISKWIILWDTNYHPARSQPAANIRLWNSSVQLKSDISAASKQKKIAAKKPIFSCASSDSPLLSVSLIAVYLLLLFFSIRFSSCRHHSRGRFLTAVMLEFVR